MLGNIGIVLAMVCAVKGYLFVVIMVELFLIECCKIMCALGVKVILMLVVECVIGMMCKVEQFVKECGWFLAC